MTSVLECVCRTESALNSLIRDAQISYDQAVCDMKEAESELASYRDELRVLKRVKEFTEKILLEELPNEQLKLQFEGCNETT